MGERTAEDPRGLISEAYRMEIDAAQCRSIFLDWALEVEDAGATIPVLLERHGGADHPMTQVLREGLAARPAARRRGGAMGRRS